MVHFLFSYGTLQLEKVQLESFGRKLVGKPDRLYSYKLGQLVITDPSVLEKSNQTVHPIAIKTNDSKDFIEGMIFEITENELKQADNYEVDDYQRIFELFESGQTAWIYVKKEMV